MIHLFYGEQTEQAREALHEFLEGFFKKNPDATLFQMDAEHWSGEKLDELLASQALFGGATVVVLDSMFQNEEAEEAVLARLKEMKDSPNVFVLLEGKLTKAVAERVAKKAESVKECAGAKEKKREAFDRFALADALGKRNKKDAWVFLQKALVEGGVPEEIHGMIFWQVKSMMLAASAKTAAEAGLNPFVFRKSLAFAKNFTEEELKKLSSKLVAIYHEAHRGGDELSIALEKFLLSL